MSIDLTHIISFACVKLLRFPLAILVMALMARNLGPSGAGLWAMYMAAGGIFSSLFLNWSQAGLVRFGREEWIKHQSFKRILLARKSLIFLGLGFSFLLLITQPGNFLEVIYHLPGECWIEVIAVSVILWLQAETQSIYRITSQFKSQILTQLTTDVIVISYLWFFLEFRELESPHQLIFGLIWVLCICWTVIWISSLLQLNCIKSFDGQNLKDLRNKMVSYCWPIIPAMIFMYISNWGNHVLIHSFGSSAEVGYFDAAYQVTIAIFSIASPLSILYLPHLIEMKLRDENAESIFFNRTVPALVVLWIAGSIFGLMLIPWLFLLIFGAEYNSAIIILNVLCAAIPGSAILALYAIRFELNNRLGCGTIYSGVMITINLLIAWLLVPYLGAVGAAIGISFSYISLQFFYLIHFHGFSRLYKDKIFIVFIFATVFGCAQAMVGSDLLSRLLLGSFSMLLLSVVTFLFRMFDSAVIRELLPGFIIKNN
jgi:O-antigen/teichoic acid export membrane protein